MRDDAIQKLVNAGLKKTEIRIQLLSHLLSHDIAISQPELEKEFKSISDRVTIYRALSSFEENGIVHKVIDLNGTARYALCSSSKCNGHKHFDEHVHFHCIDCGDVFCLEEIEIPHIQLPSTLIIQKSNLNIQGICEKCQK